ncbi:MAG TPA: glycosyltransferase family 39 protein, partial [Tepidisphaeraceae bacterium]|nr:glycosyltransferase family 39 protein [Tepidisphaeraceae bacterium]
LYRVNPPLIRLIAAAPVVLLHPKNHVGYYDGPISPTVRVEFMAGKEFMDTNGKRSLWLLTAARWACIPLSLLGGMLCFLWARTLYGTLAGIMALVLWTFSPTLLAFGHLITPDMGATALGVAAAYAFWRWLCAPSAPRLVVAGIVMGLAELCKTTWIILFVLWPIEWFAFRLLQRPRPIRFFRREWLGVIVILALAVWVINLGYCFERSFKRLGDYQFVSRTLTGAARSPNSAATGNRFAGTWLGHIRVPLPENYVSGIDIQKSEFDEHLWSYLNGRWRHGGWWYYYLFALLIKVPIGAWALGLIALTVCFVKRGYRSTPGNELCVLLPFVAVLFLVSSQTGFNHHLRYVLPIFPFMFIWASKVARSLEFGHKRLALIVGAALAWSIGSSLWVYPHSLSYFNELVGGPMGGHYHLSNSNTDWGQDLLNLRRWLDKHPEATPLHLAYDLPLIDPKMAGIESQPVPIGPQSSRAASVEPPDLGPLPGWYAVSVNKLHNMERDYDYFLDFRPVGYAGYSIYIYHITPEQADAARKKYGMAKRSAGPAPSTHAVGGN